jgi:hypothetical protein
VPAQDVHRGAAVDPTAVAVDMRTVFKAAVRDSLPHVSTWWPQILAAITTGVTNAGLRRDQQGDQNRRRSSLRERVVSQVSPNPDREMHKGFI